MNAQERDVERMQPILERQGEVLRRKAVAVHSDVLILSAACLFLFLHMVIETLPLEMVEQDPL